MTKLFLNLDIETTGLSPEEDYILEIAWDVLDENLDSALGAPRTYIVDHGSDWSEVFSALRSAPRVVRDMHQKSGLTGELFSALPAHKSEIAARIVGDLRTALSECPFDTTVHYIGFSPAFDRSFLLASRAFGVFTSEMHHRLFDLSSFKIGYELAGVEIPPSNNPNPHRAINDIAEVQTFGKLVLAALKGETL